MKKNALCEISGSKSNHNDLRHVFAGTENKKHTGRLNKQPITNFTPIVYKTPLVLFTPWSFNSFKQNNAKKL